MLTNQMSRFIRLNDVKGKQKVVINSWLTACRLLNPNTLIWCTPIGGLSNASPLQKSNGLYLCAPMLELTEGFVSYETAIQQDFFCVTTKASVISTSSNKPKSPKLVEIMLERDKGHDNRISWLFGGRWEGLFDNH